MARKESFVKTIQPVCEKLASDMGLSFYDISLDREPAGLYLRIYIDAEGGLSLDQCEAYHRAVQPKVERYEYDFLEVCSPGIDRPLKTQRDIDKSIGLLVEAKMYKPTVWSRRWKRWKPAPSRGPTWSGSVHQGK